MGNDAGLTIKVVSMQNLRFFGGNLNGFTRLLISFPYTAHIDCIDSNITILNNTAFPILVKRTLRQGDILKPLQFSFYFVSLLSFVYFGENNNSNVLKSLNIGYVITDKTVFSICSQYVEFYKVFPRKVSDKANGTFMS